MSTSSIQVQITDAEYKLLQTLVYQECGMYFDERRAHFLQDRLQRRLKLFGLDTFYAYYRLLTSHQGKRELAALVENLTVNETSFFRNKPQLDLFSKRVLEDLLHRKQERRDWTLRFWSAGCSTGPEPYTMAMLVCDALAYYYLRTAQEAVYSESQMDAVDYAYRLRYFDKVGDRYAVKRSLKELIHFDFHNLKTEFLPARNDVIFCRNVMIYFDEAEQKRLIEKFYRCLNPESYLFIGHAESLFGLSDKYKMIHQNNGTAYQRTEVSA